MVEIVCAATGEAKQVEANVDGSPKLPRGWRRVGTACYSPKAWARAYRPRSVRLPVASVATADVRGELGWSAIACKRAWEAFNEACFAAWRAASAYANDALFRFATLDAALPLEQTPKGPRLPKVPKETRAAWLREVYALGEGYAALDSQSRAQIRNDVLSDYNALRWDLRVTHKAVSRGYKFPYPVPFPASFIQLWEAGNGWFYLRLRIGSRAFVLRLSGSYRYARALESLRRTQGEQADAVLGQVSLSQRTVFGDNENRRAADTPRDRKQTVVTLTVYLPVVPRTTHPTRTLFVRAASPPDPLFEARVGDEAADPWRLHADDLFRLLALRDRRRQRLADDRKFERRGASREQYERMAGRAVERAARAVDDQLHKRARELVNFAVRRGCGKIRYETKALTGPASKLRELVTQKAAESGITLEVAGEVAEAERSPVIGSAPAL